MLWIGYRRLAAHGSNKHSAKERCNKGLCRVFLNLKSVAIFISVDLRPIFLLSLLGWILN
jgi:hypothetical protein